MTSTPQHIVVTGATGGVGQALTRRLLARGDAVIALGRSEEKLAALTSLKGSDNLTTLRIDFLHDDLNSIPIPAALDGIVHTAAIANHLSVEEANREDWQQAFAIDVFAPALVTRAVLPALKQAHGTVVFVNSGAGQHPTGGNSVYGAAKHALRSLADSFRQEVENDDVRVATVYPGPINTPMWHRDPPVDVASERLIQPQDVAAAIITVLDAAPNTQITDLTLRPRQELGTVSSR